MMRFIISHIKKLEVGWAVLILQFNDAIKGPGFLCLARHLQCIGLFPNLVPSCCQGGCHCPTHHVLTRQHPEHEVVT